MTRELIIKFRNDIALTPNLPLLQKARLPEGYFANAAAFVGEAYPRSAPVTNRSLGTDVQWQGLQASLQLLVTLGAQVEYLFIDNPVEVPLTLLRSIQKPAQSRYKRLTNLPVANPSITAAPVPNLYNYFRIQLPEPTRRLFGLLPDPVEAVLAALLNVVFSLWNAGPSLLEQAYIQEEPVPLGQDFATPTAAGAAGANQAYYQAMNIPTDPDKQGANVNLTVVEANSWFTGHSRFSYVKAQGDFPVCFPKKPFQTPLFTLTDPLGHDDLADHGTAVLGILKAAENQGAPDGCRGLIPRASVRLASCLKTIEFSANNAPNPVDKAYNEAGAVLQAVVGSDPGDVVLLEFGYLGETYPAETAPAIFDILCLANRKGVIVVEAAGNDGAYIDAAVTPDQLRPSDVLAFKLLLTQATMNSGQAMTNYQKTKNQIAAAYQALGLSKTAYKNADDFARKYLTTDTGAVLVGATRAGVAEVNGKFVARDKSSWGPRVLIFAQGDKILTTTCAYQGTTAQNSYTWIGFTSGAAAIMAGFIASLQGYARSRGRSLMPSELPQLLGQGTGVVRETPPPNGAGPATFVAVNGVVPDYGQAIRQIDRLIAG